MPRITGDIVIERPVVEVFDFAADERNEPAHNAQRLTARMFTRAPVGLRPRFAAVHRGRRQPVELQIEFAEHQRPRRLPSIPAMAVCSPSTRWTPRPACAGTGTCPWLRIWPRHPLSRAGAMASLVGRLSVRHTGLRGCGLAPRVRAIPQAERHPGASSTFRLHFVYISSTFGDMASPDTTTVRVRRPDSERLQSLARTRQTPVIDVVHAAIGALERQDFLRGLDEDYQQLRNDPERWQHYLAERREWDTLA